VEHPHSVVMEVAVVVIMLARQMRHLQPDKQTQAVAVVAHHL